jgi:hypothetical protein
VVVGVLASDVTVFDVEYVDHDLIRRREPLTACWSERFERLSPVRKIRPYPGQRSITRDYWVATTRARLACESHLERHHAMLLDFDPQVVGLAGQPFRLFWPGRRGRQGHVPDLFVRRHDGQAVVVDVRPGELIEPEDAEAFAATARACELAGWAFRRVGTIEPVLLENVKWLAGYRRARFCDGEIAGSLMAAFAQPRTLFDGAYAVGDGIRVLPVLYHLLWLQKLRVDVARVRLGPDSVVSTPSLPGGP